ncbi:MAG: hypothetical protein A2W99_10830 [Bacteroidetes bacterium GWF2_33_16]|nr:MAG: hypothetical protein A2X00_04910 [Bacteroidetes bacterium GWE2_32_14]OFY04033.1 MAG: hypothetical protein A2W99_10830 [Bacteroidetes bacterium GWF2_33_16]
MNRKNYVISIQVIIIALIMISCSKEELNQISDSKLKGDTVRFLPLNPSSSDEVFIIDSICQYELLKTIEINGFQINYIRTFISGMGLACFPEIDTVSLGKLDSGNYTLFNILIDRNPRVQDSIARVDTFHVIVQ